MESLMPLLLRYHLTMSGSLHDHCTTNLLKLLSITSIDGLEDADDADDLAPDHRCLQQVAQTIRSVPNRPGDFVARFSGQQFAVILPDTDRVGAIEVAESIRRTVESTFIPRSAALEDRSITVCVGVTVMDPYSEVTAPRLLAAARQALSVARAEGPNQTRVALLEEARI